MRGIIICDDNRYFFMKDYLENRGVKFVEKNESADFIVFPFKDDIDRVFFNEDYFMNLSKSTLIFSGIENEYIYNMALKNSLDYCSLMSVNSVRILNSIPTSEGVIYFILDKLDRTIFNSNSLVIGYGKCGKSISDRLIGLGSNVDIIVNSNESKSLAILNRLNIINFNEAIHKNYDFIINTVPKNLILADDINKINKDVLIIDIASEPYGFKKERMINKNYFQISGIPGEVLPKTAGEILGEYVFWRLIN